MGRRKLLNIKKEKEKIDFCLVGEPQIEVNWVR